MIGQAGQAAKGDLAGSIKLSCIIKGIVVSYIITIPVFMIFAFILANTEFPEKLISPAVLITTIISLLTAGISATKGTKSKGWLNGCIVGFVYMLILYFASSIAMDNFSIDRYIITMGLIGVITGAMGGIIGINFKSKSYSKVKRRK